MKDSVDAFAQIKKKKKEIKTSQATLMVSKQKI